MSEIVITRNPIHPLKAVTRFLFGASKPLYAEGYVLEPAIMDKPLPYEPEGISVSERHALWSGLLIKDRLPLKQPWTKTSDTTLFAIFLSVICVAEAVAFTFLGTEFIIGRHVGEMLFYLTGLMGSSYFLMTVMWKKSGMYSSMASLLETIEESRWENVFMKAVRTAQEEKCNLCPEIEALFLFMQKTLRHELDIPAIPAADIIGMTRLSSGISGIATASISGRDIGISGENSELLGRVAETISYRSLDSMVQELVNPEKVTL